MAIEEIVDQAHAQVDLTSCDLEPIHHIGAIQPVGFLIAISADWLISRLSANAPEFIGGSIESLLGAPFSDIFVKEAVHAIRNRVTMLRGPDAVEQIFAIRLQDGKALFDVAVHVTGATIIFEAEPSQSPVEYTTCTVWPAASRMKFRAVAAAGSGTLAKTGASAATVGRSAPTPVTGATSTDGSFAFAAVPEQIALNVFASDDDLQPSVQRTARSR